MNSKQFKLMWGVIAAVVLCMVFPLTRYYSQTVEPDETATFKNPQYGMLSEEWWAYKKTFRVDPAERTSERGKALKKKIPADIYESGNWLDRNENDPPRLSTFDWGFWDGYRDSLANEEFVTWTRKGAERNKWGWSPGFVFTARWEDINKQAWVVEIIIIGLVAGGLWVQFVTNSKGGTI